MSSEKGSLTSTCPPSGRRTPAPAPRSIHPAFVAAIALLALVVVLMLSTSALGRVELRTEEDKCKVGEALEPVSFEMTAYYFGPQNYTVAIFSLLDEPEGWTHLFTGSSREGESTSPRDMWLIIARGEVANVSLEITPGERASAGDHSFEVNASLEGEPGVHSDLQFCVAILQWTDLDMRFRCIPEEGYRVCAGSFTDLAVELENTGNGMDRFYVTSTSSRGLDLWIAHIHDGLDKDGMTPGLRWGEFARLTMRLSVPESAEAGESAELFVQAISAMDKETGMTIRTVVTVCHAYGIQAVVVGPAEAAVSVDFRTGAIAAFEFNVTNLGNGPDQVTAWAEPVLVHGLGFSCTVDPPSETIPMNGSARYMMSIKVPPHAAAMEHTFRVMFASSGPVEAMVCDVSVHVDQYTRLVMYMPESNWTVAENGALLKTVTIVNEGNGLDMVRMELNGLPDNMLSWIDPQIVTILPMDCSTVSICIVVPESSWKHILSPSYDLALEAWSTMGPAHVRLPVQLGIVALHKVAWGYVAGGVGEIIPPDVTIDHIEQLIGTDLVLNPAADQGDLVVEGFQVWNLGTSPVTVTLKPSSRDLGVVLEPRRVQIPHAGSTDVTFTVSGRLALSPGEYAVNCSAIIEDHPEFQPLSIPLRVTVIKLDLAVESLTVEGRDIVHVGTGRFSVCQYRSVRFNWTVRNLGSRPVQGVKLDFIKVDPNGDREVLSTYEIGLASSGTTSRSVVWYAHQVGEHSFVASLELGNQSRADNDIATLSVVVTSAEGGSDGGPALSGIGDPLLSMVLVGAIAVVVFFIHRIQRRGRKSGPK